MAGFGIRLGVQPRIGAGAGAGAGREGEIFFWFFFGGEGDLV